MSNGTINHSSVIAVLDRRGVVQSRIDGITPGDPRLVARVTAALERAARGLGDVSEAPRRDRAHTRGLR